MPLAMTGAAGLLEPHPEVVGQGAGVELQLREVAPEHQGHDDVERLDVAGGEQPPGPFGGAVDHGRLLGVEAAAGHDVGAVAVHGDEQGLEGAAHGGQVDVGEHVPGQPHQPVDLGGLHVVDDEPLRLRDDLVERHPVGRGIRPQPVERLDPRRGREHLLHPQQRVVAGGAGAAPVVGQPLLALEDLLDHHPRVTGGVGQPLEVAARGRPGRRGGRCATRRPRRARAATAAARGSP